MIVHDNLGLLRGLTPQLLVAPVADFWADPDLFLLFVGSALHERVLWRYEAMAVSLSLMEAHLPMLTLYTHLMRVVGAEILHPVVQLLRLETWVDLISLCFVV